MVTAGTVISRARTQLIDTDQTSYRWTDQELLLWLSDGQRAVVAIKPDSSNKVAVVTLAAGTRQTLPPDGNMLLNVIRNMAPDGVTPSRAVRIVEREVMDNQNPYWHTDPSAALVQNYIFDPTDRVSYYVYPPNDGTGKVEINYSVEAGDLENLTDTLIVQDIYRTPLLDYVLFRAYQKNTDELDMQKANSYWQSFATFMGQDSQGETVDNPNQQMTPFNTSVRGQAR